MYPTNDARDVDIETGATRPAVDVVADLQASAQRFAKAIMDMSDDGWERTVRPGIGGTGEAVPGRRVLWLRLRELELRHVDLDAGYVPASWPSAFVERALDEAMRSLSRRDDVPSMIVRVEGGVTERVGSDAEVTVTGSPAAILGWLTGRAAGTDVHCEPHGALPVLPAWW
jgi:maleylpyruvate isomerase